MKHIWYVVCMHVLAAQRCNAAESTTPDAVHFLKDCVLVNPKKIFDDIEYHRQCDVPTGDLEKDPYFAPVVTPTSQELYRSAYPVHWAAAQGKLDELQTSLDHRDYSRSQDRIEYIQGILACCRSNDCDLAHPDCLDNHGLTPLMVAARYGKASISVFLLQQGFNPALVNKDGYDALSVASFHGHTMVVEALVKRYKPRNSDFFIQQGITLPSHLIEPGWSTATDPGMIFTTPLIEACRAKTTDPHKKAEREKRQLAVVQALLKNQSIHDNVNAVRVKIPPAGSTFSDGDENGCYAECTALSAAAANGYPIIVRKLIEAGAEINSYYGPRKTTALDEAVHKKETQCAILLLAQGAILSNQTGSYLEEASYKDVRSALRDAFKTEPKIARQFRTIDYN